MPHRALGVAANASTAQIKKAFRKLALVYHPDVPGTGDPKRFQALQDAYDEMIMRRTGTSSWSGEGTSQQSPNWSHHQQQRSDHRWERDQADAEREAQRREFERLRREWRQQHEEEMRETPESRERKWHYFGLVCAWVGIGSIAKLMALRFAHVARENELQAGGAASSWPTGLAPVAPEDARRRTPQATLPSRQ